jgi:hypothetical protein
MSFVEFIGFVIIFLSLTSMYLQYLAKQRPPKKEIEDMIPEKEEVLIEEKEEQELILPPSLTHAVAKKKAKLSSLEEFIVMKEILDKPRSLKDFNDVP